jgi:TetR/AcrR family transcriptional repressor of nem operon
VTQGVGAHAALLSELMSGATAEERERQAWFTYATLVGAVVLARALDDSRLSKAVLEAVAEGLLEGHRERPAAEIAKARK